jgi:hypothetical protein
MIIGDEIAGLLWCCTCLDTTAHEVVEGKGDNRTFACCDCATERRPCRRDFDVETGEAYDKPATAPAFDGEAIREGRRALVEEYRR